MLSQPTHAVRFLYDLGAPMRDGVRLSTDVYLPAGGGSFPAILLRTPYESTRDQHVDWAVWWARRGYAAVVQDCRGKFESGGSFYAYRDEGPDGHDTLRWLADQPWCDGKIGMSGRSYGGIVQWQAATQGPSPLTAMAPQVIMGDYFGEYHRIGGAVQWALTALAAVTFASAVALTQRGCAQIFGNQRFYRHLPLISADEALIGRKIAYFRDWLEHSTYDEYWAALDTHRLLDRVDVPACQQGAWYDPYTAAMFRLFNGLRARAGSELARAGQKIYIVPWTHHAPEGARLGDLDFGPGAYVDLNHEDLRWFDHWLKGGDSGYMDEPPIKIFVMGANVWRHEREWPLARTVYTPYYLHSGGRANTLYGDGALSPEPPGAEPADRYSYDPADPTPTLGGNHSLWTLIKYAAEPVYPGPIDQRPIERRDDVLCYTSPPLAQDLEITGPLELFLYAATSARDTDFTAKLVDVYPSGHAIHIAEGIIRCRYRSGLDRIDPPEPGEAARYRVELAATSNVFRRGHRLRLEISSSNFPRFDRNLNTGDDCATGTRMEVARQTVLHSAAYPSHLLLPVIP